MLLQETILRLIGALTKTIEHLDDEGETEAQIARLHDAVACGCSARVDAIATELSLWVDAQAADGSQLCPSFAELLKGQEGPTYKVALATGGRVPPPAYPHVGGAWPYQSFYRRPESGVMQQGVYRGPGDGADAYLLRSKIVETDRERRIRANAAQPYSAIRHHGVSPLVVEVIVPAQAAPPPAASEVITNSADWRVEMDGADYVFTCPNTDAAWWDIARAACAGDYPVKLQHAGKVALFGVIGVLGLAGQDAYQVRLRPV